MALQFADESDDLPTFLRVDEVAALLRVNRKTVYEAVQRGDIPGVVRLGRLIRFRRDDVLAWMSSSAR